MQAVPADNGCIIHGWRPALSSQTIGFGRCQSNRGSQQRCHRDVGEGQCAIQVDPADSGCRINRGCASLSSQNLGLRRCRSKLAVRGCDRRFIKEQASERSATSESAAACRASTKLWCSNCCTRYPTEADSEDHCSGALSGEQQQRQQQPRNWYSVVPTSSPGAHFDSSASKAYRQASKASSISSRASSTSKESAI